MLDAFEIITSSGVVLWSKQYAPLGPNIINSLIKDVLIENRSALGSDKDGDDSSAARNPPYKKERYTLKYTTSRDIGLIFVAVYQSIIHLSWVDQLLDNIRTIFTSLYREQFRKPYTSVIECPFDEYFDRQLSELEKTSGGVSTSSESVSSAKRDAQEDSIAPPVPGLRVAKTSFTNSPATNETSPETTPITTPDTSRPATPNTSSILTDKKLSRRARKAVNASSTSSRDASISRTPESKPQFKKTARRWDEHGNLDESDPNTVLDYSSTTNAAAEQGDAQEASLAPEISSSGAWNKKTASGDVILRDLDEEMSSILSAEAERKRKEALASTVTKDGLAGTVNSGLSSITGFFSSIVGGKTLTATDLEKPLKAMEDHLIDRNVARPAAVQLVTSVRRDLLGTSAPSLTSLDGVIKQAMSTALSRILTPTSTLDILRSIQARRSANAAIVASAGSKATTSARPYVISIVGVNGVGKSTTLAKLAFLLLHNDLRILVAAGDTFRSGAVEQLRVHVRNLKQLTARENLGYIDLYERGYGKDAAHVARDAVAYAAAPNGPEDSGRPYDVVLIDTAGRRHNDQRLMSSLAPFAKLANPDKILMVGEALVGTDSVAQAQHFNESFGTGRRLDGFIVSKCDTVGEMVGTLVSLVAATGVPIVAVGVGQHYGDLRGFRADWARDLLLD